jgi:hypothetical protein
MAAVDTTVARKVKSLRDRSIRRDAAMMRVRMVRDGQIELLQPESFNDRWPKSVVANFIDTAAQDTSEMLAPLPALNCASGTMRSDADKSRAMKKNKIANHYWEQSCLENRMYAGADRFLSYGFLPFYVEVDYDRQTPIIHLDDPMGAYYDNDRFGRTRTYVKVWREAAATLAALFPEYATAILTPSKPSLRVGEDTEIEVIRYCDDDKVVLYLPDRQGLVLARYANPISRCPAQVAEWPTLSGFPRGRFDDLIWVQLARSVMALLAMEAGWEAVNAPIQLPKDASRMPMGPKSIIRTDGAVRRVPLEIPQSAFEIGATLEQELQQGARYPGARSGQVNASVITGRGIQELLGSFDSQVRKAQAVIGDSLKLITSVAFEVDEKVFGSSTKTINGVLNGESYQLTYTPARDINGNYVCDITYGFAAGLSAQSAVVLMLQLRGDNLISRDTVRRQLPWAVDVDHEQRTIDVQETEDALKQGLFAYAQALGPAIQAGMDPNEIVKLMVAVIQGRRDGKSLADVVGNYYDQRAQEQAQAAAEQPAGPGGGGAPGMPGVQPSGLPEGVAPGQAGMPPGGLAGLVNLLAGTRGASNAPVMNATVSKRIATG